MASIKIVCPGCRASFVLKAPSIQSVASKNFRCPKCGTTTSFGHIFNVMRQSQPFHTNIGGASLKGRGFNSHTRIAGPPLGKLLLEVKELGRDFQLGYGTYTLGRESEDSRASLKIAPDRYMSRQQAVLEIEPSHVPEVPLLVRISNISPTNPIYVNDKKLDTGMNANLKNGDVLLLGMTKVEVIM